MELPIKFDNKKLNHLVKKYNISLIVLFGSYTKGIRNKNSDIDIFVQDEEKKINLTNFERKLKHDINIIFEDDINKLSNELFNNIINGIKLYGYLKLK